MGQPVLSAIITADGRGFTKTLGELQQQLKRFQESMKSAGNVESFQRLQRAATETQRRIDALKNIGNPLKPVMGGANEATQSLINLGRVVQDAPFGFLGIANNLNPLQESFARTSASAGGFGNAMKAIGKSVLGPGGIGLAISAISTALIVFGDKLFGAGKAFNQAEIDAANFRIQLDKLSTSLDTFKENLKFETEFDRLRAESRGLEGVNLSIFDAQRTRQDNEKTIAENKKALLELDAQQDELFGKVTGRARDLRDLFLGNLASIPDNLISDLDKQGQASLNALIDVVKKRQALQKENQVLSRQIVIQQLTETKANNEKTKEEEEKRLKDQEKFFNDTIKRARLLAAFLDKTTIRSFNFDVDAEKSLSENFKRAVDFIQKALDPLERRNFPVKTNITLEANVKFKGSSGVISSDSFLQQTFESKEATKTYDQLKKSFEDNINRAAAANPLVLQLAANVKLGQDFEKRLKDAADQINSSVNQFFENSLAGIGEGLGNLISGQNFGTAVVDAIGDLLTQIGKALIKYGTIKLTIEKLLKSLNISGAAAIGIGIAAIALGRALKNSSKNLDGFRATGGPVGAGKSYVVGERGPEIFVPSVGGNIIPNNRIGSGTMAATSPQPVMLGGQFIIQGSDLVLLLAQVQRSQGRLT